MIILVGPSASGKTSIAKKLIEDYNFTKLVTNTTRSPRVGEKNDIDYHFISKEEFIKKINNNEFIEYITYNGNYYGTLFSELSDNKVLIVDILGANKYYDYLKDKAMFVYTECSDSEYEKRMIERGDSKEDITKRMSGDKTYFNKSLMKHIDMVIDTTTESVSEVTKKIYDEYINRKER